MTKNIPKMSLDTSIKWITANTRLKDGIALVNNVSTETFKKLLKRLVTSDNESHFSEEELSQLKKTLSITDENLNLLMQTVIYIFKQSNKVVLKPTHLQKHLIDNLIIAPEKAVEFVRIWAEYLKSEVGDFENRLIVKDITWELNMQIADQIEDKQSVSMARLKFGLGKSRASVESFTVEMDEDDLSQLYHTLETVQLKLDNINIA